jgi:hypothetical protein
MRQLLLLFILCSAFTSLQLQAQDTASNTGKSYIAWPYYPLKSPYGHPLSKTHYVLIKGIYVVESKWIYTYDIHGDLSTLVYQVQDNNGQLKNDQKYLYNYDNNGLLQSVILQNVAWNGSWQNTAKDSIAFDDHNNWVYLQTQSWANAKWQDPDYFQRIVYRYGKDGNIIYILMEKKSSLNASWLAEYKDSCILDIRGHIKNRLVSMGSYASFYYYLHLQNNNISQILCDSARDYNSTRYNYTRDSSTYTIDGKPVMTSSISADSSGIQHSQTAYYTYNEHGDQVKLIQVIGEQGRIDTSKYDMDSIGYNILGYKTVDKHYSVSGAPVYKDVWEYGDDAIAEQMRNENNLIIYPNPASDMIHLQFKENPDHSANIELFDMQGRKARVWPSVYSQDKTLDLSVQGLPSGMYYLKAGTQGCRVVIDGE